MAAKDLTTMDANNHQISTNQTSATITSFDSNNVGQKRNNRPDPEDDYENQKKLYKIKREDYGKTFSFLIKVNLFSMVLCVLLAAGCGIDLYFIMNSEQAKQMAFEQTFIIVGICLSSIYVFFMYMIRDQWPINVCSTIAFYLWVGVVLGFLLCTHLKLIVKSVHNSTTS